MDDFAIVRIEDGQSLTTSKMAREDFLEEVANGKILESQIKQFIKRIRVPALSGLEHNTRHAKRLNMTLYQDIADNINSNPGLRILFQILCKEPLDKSVEIDDIGVFMKKYDSPNKFDKLVLEMSEETLSNEQSRDMQIHASKIGHIIYGDQYKYWEQWKLLKNEAIFINKHESIFSDLSVEELTKEEKEGLRGQIAIHGDPFKGKILSVDDIYRNGLEPHYKISFGNIQFIFSSRTYAISDRRPAVVGYVKTSGTEIIARSFYLSGSHVVWKYLPRYLPQWIGDGIRWYDKGFNEQSISLPPPLQEAIAEISGINNPPIEIEDSNLIFAGTAREIPMIDPKNQHITYQNEVREKPIRLSGNLSTGQPGRLVPPEKLKLDNEGDFPDFDTVIRTWEQFSPIYGQVTVETYKSINGEYEYMFCQDKNNRVWIGACDTSTHIGSTGLREKWVDIGDLSTPAFQYKQEADKYGNPEMTNGCYVDMYKNYLSKVPLIKEYLRHKKQRGSKASS